VECAEKFQRQAAAGGPILGVVAAIAVLVAALVFLKMSIDDYKAAKAEEEKALAMQAGQQKKFGAGQIGAAQAKGETIREIAAMRQRGEITKEQAVALRARAQKADFGEGTEARTAADKRGYQQFGTQGATRYVPGFVDPTGPGVKQAIGAADWLGSKFGQARPAGMGGGAPAPVAAGTQRVAVDLTMDPQAQRFVRAQVRGYSQRAGLQGAY